MKQDMTMGSLFSGSGGFELASDIFGISPRWASEIEPLPMLITKKNFPELPHLGDIRYINGGKVKPVTVIAGGSPCQDMSVAGQREGLDGSRSNLFYEQIRVIKEMRKHDIKAGRTGKYIRPRYMVWENVPGAFSSNKGQDFQAVLQAIASVKDDTATVPLPAKGKWQAAGCTMGDTFSIAWRTLDAQYWGVPQRRKRIYLVADFGGRTAPKILLEREGLSRDFKESRQAWQETAGTVKDGTHKASRVDETIPCYDISDRRKVVAENENLAPTLQAKMGTGGNNVPIVIETHGQDARWNLSEDNIVQTLASNMGTGGGNVPMILDGARSVDLRNQTMGEDKSETLHGNGHGSSVATIIEPTAVHLTQDPTTMEGISPCITQGNPKTGQATIGVVIPIADKATRYKGGGDTRNNDGSANGLGIGEPGAPANTLTAADRHAVACAIDRAAFNQGINAQYDISIQEELAQTLVAKGPGAVADPHGDMPDAVCYAMQAFGQYKESEIASTLKERDYKDNTDLILSELMWEYIIRRLTPLECCRLQGFPDNWTEGIAITDPKPSVIREWMIAWAEWWRLIGRDEGIQLPKDAKQVERWLADPASDSGLYKMWGNGIALPCAMFVMEGIAEVLREENSHEPE